MPRSFLQGVNTLVWRLTENSKLAGLFADKVLEESNEAFDAAFLWRICHGAVPTRVWLQSRGLTVSSGCPWGCSAAEEAARLRAVFSVGLATCYRLLDGSAAWTISFSSLQRP